MKTPSHLRSLLAATAVTSLACLAPFNVQADTILQTVNQSTTTGTANGWLLPVFGTPAAVAVAGNDYVIPSGFTLRTPNSLTPGQFAGDKLIVQGTLAIKSGNAVLTQNLVLAGGSVNHSQGPTSPTATTNIYLAGTMVVSNNSTLNTSSGSGIRDITLQAVLSGSGNLTIPGSTNMLHVDCDASGYSGNWTINGGVSVYRGGPNPLGMGAINMPGASSRLIFRSSTDIELAQPFGGVGALTQTGPGKLHIPDLTNFTGTVTVNGGMLLLDGPGYQTATTVAGEGVLRVAHNAALGSGAALTVTPNNAQTGRLELSNNVSIQTGQAIAVSMRNNNTAAIRSVSGNNIIADPVGIQSGGGLLWIESTSGATLDLSGGVTSLATGGRNFTLQGDGVGTVSGVIENGSATTVTVNKAGAGTWTLNVANTYTGNTVVSNGVLRLGASGTVASSPVLQVNEGGVLDVSAAGGLTLNAQILRGNGAVVGDITTTAGTSLEVGFANQYGQLSLSNNLTLGGGELIRFDLSSAANDVLFVGGNITLNGVTTNAINLPLGQLDNGTYRLVHYSGALIGGGNFELAVPGTRQTMVLDFATPHEISLVVVGNPAALTWSGDGLLNSWDVGTTKNWNLQTEAFYNGDFVTFNDTGSNVPDIEIVTTVAPASIVVSNETKNFTVTGANISTLGTLTKQGAGTLALASDGNDIRGKITIAAGTLQIGTNSLTGSLGSGEILNNGTLVMDKLDGSGTTLNGSISGTGAIVVRGGGALNLRGTNNTFAGPATVEFGNLDIARNNALGETNAGTTVLAGSRLGITTLGNYEIAEPVTLNGEGLAAYPGALYVNTASNKVTWLGPITLASASRIRAVNNYIYLGLSNRVTGADQGLWVSAEGNASSTVAFWDTLNLGTGALSKDGAGAMILAGTTNLAGGTTVSAGTLTIVTTNPPAIGEVVVNGGIVQIGDGGPNGSFPVGQVNLAGSGGVLRFNTAKDVVLDREVFGAGGLAKLNTNKLTIGISNSFAGGVTTGSGTPTTGGTILLRNSYGLGDGLAAKTISIIRSELQLEGNLDIPEAIAFQTSGGTFVTDVGIGLIPIRSLSGNNIIRGAVSLIGGAGDSEIAVDSGTLTINGVVAPNYSSTRGLRLSGAGTGILNQGLGNGNTTASLTKQGSGKWTLNGASDYSGATLITGGTLALGAAATIANTPTITLQSNATFDVSALASGFELGASQALKGDGTIIGKVNALGTVGPGQSVGALSFTGALTLGGATVMEVSRSGSTLSADRISAASIQFGGTLTVTNIGAEFQGGEVFDLFDGVLSGSFASVELPPLTNPELSWNTDDFATQGIIRISGGSAPPATILPPAVSGGNFTIQFQSVTGYNYVLESATNLVSPTWRPVQTNAGGGLITIPVLIDPLKPVQFFRVTSGN